MLVISGLANLVEAVCAALGCRGCWFELQFDHELWQGMRFLDTIFPLFMFLSGATWPISYAKSRARGLSRGAIVRKLLVRSWWLVALAVLTNPHFFELSFGMVRWNTELTQIGICGAAAALLYMFVDSVRTRLAIAAAILVGYWLLLKFTVAPDLAAMLASTDPEIKKAVETYAAFGTDGFSFYGNVAGWIERTFVPGFKWEPAFDPDGWLCKIPGVVSSMLGVFAGEILCRRDLTGNRKAALLAGCGAICLALCLVWAPWCPVIKKIWTSTFVLGAGAYCFLVLAAFYWLIDVKGVSGWTFFFRVIGMNAITIYVLRRFFDFGWTARFFFGGCTALLPGDWGAVLIQAGYVAIEWLILLAFYRKGIFVKL